MLGSLFQKIRERRISVLILVIFVCLGFLTAFAPTFSQDALAQFKCKSGSNQCSGKPDGSPYTTSNCDGQCGSFETCVAISLCPPTPDEAAADPATAKLAETAAAKGAELILDYGINPLLTAFNSAMKYLVAMAASIMDFALYVSVAPFTDLEFINAGWKITRDVANIFFIFILLTIAIATILRIESYGAKKLLAKLIIVALLINFSMVIAGVVVDASNVLAIAFLQKITPASVKIAQSLHLSAVDNLVPPPNTPPPGAVPGQPFSVAPGYKTAIAAGSTGVVPNADQVLLEAMGGGGLNKANAEVKELILLVGSILLQLGAALILIAIAILVIIRTAVLMVLFILAPFGFIGIILPRTESYAMKWWTQLFQQSFFLPIAAFFIYLAIYYGLEIKRLSLSGNATLNTAILFNYFIVLALLYMSLYMANQLGAYGAGAMVKYSQDKAKKARDRLTKGVKDYTSGVATRYTAPAISRLEASSNIFARGIKKLPFAQRGMQNLAAKERANIEERKKFFDKQTSAELRRRSTKVGTNATDRAAILAKLAERGDVEYEAGVGFSREHVRDSMKHMQRLGQSIKSVLRLDPSLTERKPGQTLGEAMREQNIRPAAADIEKMDESVITPETMRALAETSSPGTLQAIANRGGRAFTYTKQAFDDIVTASAHAGTNMEKLEYELTQLGNAAVGRFIRSTPAGSVFQP